MTDITAKLNYYRMAPRKVRLAADLVRGKNLTESLAQLKFSKNKAALTVSKLLKSALSNAKQNFKINEEEKLFVKKITVDEGPTLKRFMPRARGSVSPIRKRTSHITVILSSHE
jgi:large subunit ribosomal protein L22